MDGLVFARETLRRSLLECLELLEKAAGSYDPECDMPKDDIAASIAVGFGLPVKVVAYQEEVVHRMKSRAGGIQP